MRRSLTVTAVLVGLVIATPVTAGISRAPQHIRIEASGANGETFVLTPVTSGRIQADTGALAFCCWTTTHIVRAGESLDVNDPHLTFTGAHGILRVRNHIEWVDLPDGWSMFTGTWHAVGGTGAYEHLSGSGRVAGVSTSTGFTRVKYFGSLIAK